MQRAKRKGQSVRSAVAEDRDVEVKTRSAPAWGTEEDDDANVEVDLSALIAEATSRFSELCEADKTGVGSGAGAAAAAAAAPGALAGAAVRPSLDYTSSATVPGAPVSSSTFMSSKALRSTLKDPLQALQERAEATGALVGAGVSAARFVSKGREAKPDTAGKAWFDLPATKMTDELKMDFRLMRLRQYLSPKDFTNREKSHRFPKYFQIGHEVGGPADAYSGQGVKRKAAGSFVEEVLKDGDTRRFLKRKFKEVQDATQAKGRVAKRHAKDARNRKKGT